MSKDTTEVRMVSATGGQKGVKIARYELMPAGPVYQVACLYGVGALKYPERNFESGYPYSQSFGALNRHLWAWWNGENLDPETGITHLASVVWNAFALMHFQLAGVGVDDRPPSVELIRPDDEHIALMRELGERFRAQIEAATAQDDTDTTAEEIPDAA